MIYNYFAYIIGLIWLYHKVVYPFYPKIFPLLPLSIVCCLPIISGISLVDYFYSLFAQPSILLVLLLITSWLPMIPSKWMPDRVLSAQWLKKIEISLNNDSVHILEPFNKKVWIWIALSSTLILFNALGLTPFDIYQRVNMSGYFSLSYLVFLLFFIVAIQLDKRFLIIAWLTLVAYIFGVMESTHILDYIADFWLFLCSIYMFVISLIKVCIIQVNVHIKNNKS